VRDLVVLLDVDNTLLDNDLIRADLAGQLTRILGPKEADRFWKIYEEVRAETDVVNFPETLERLARECRDTACLGDVSAVLYDFPFSKYVYPHSISAVQHVSAFATPVILSDGDQLFRRHKIRAAGLEDAVSGNVLIYVHKEQNTADMQARFPARHYAVIDDKPRIHAAMKKALGEKITTVMVCQGKYAHDPAHHDFPDADVTMEGIGGLLALNSDQLARTPQRGGGRR